MPGEGVKEERLARDNRHKTGIKSSFHTWQESFQGAKDVQSAVFVTNLTCKMFSLN